MVQFAGFVQTDTSKGEAQKRSRRAKLRLSQRQVARARRMAEAVKRDALIARLRASADQADDPANWISLAGMSDDELKADLFRP